MIDQATILRGLVENRSPAPAEAVPTDTPQVTEYVFPRLERNRFARTLALIGGKGGVGKSNLALNLAIALAEQDCRVCLLDASPGTGTVELLCGTNAGHNFHDVLKGTHTLKQALQKGPGGIRFLSGAQRLFQHDFTPSPDLRRELYQLEQDYQMILIDAGTGLQTDQTSWHQYVDEFLLVSTPEPTSIAESYGLVKALKGLPLRGRIDLLLNQTSTVQQAQKVAAGFRQTAKQFLQTDVDFAGAIPHDPTLSLAVFKRQPLCLEFPTSPAARAVNQLGRKLFQSRPFINPPSTSFISSLWPISESRQSA